MFRRIIIPLCLCGGLLAQTNMAVVDFTGKNVSAEEASALTDRLRIELFKTKKFTVIERERMDTILKEQGFQLSDCTDDACIVEMGQLVGVEQIVAGSVSRVGRVYSIAARIIGVEKGDLVNIATFDHEGEIGDLLKFGMQNIALQLAGLTTPPTPTPTPSPETVASQPPTTTPPPQPQLSPKVASKNLRLGVLFGYGASRVWGDDISKKLALHPANSGGIIALFRLQKQLFLRTEMLLARKGWTENYTGLTGDDVEHTIDLDYLQIPFLVQFNLPVAGGTEMYFLGGVAEVFPFRMPDGKELMFPERPPKIETPTAADFAWQTKVGYQDLDTNEHVNNVRYIDWIYETFTLEFLRSHHLRQLEINYLAEAFYGQSIAVTTQKSAENTFIHTVAEQSGDTALCRARTVWR